MARRQSKVDLQRVSSLPQDNQPRPSPFTLPRPRRHRRRSRLLHARPRLQSLQNTLHILRPNRLDLPSAPNNVPRVRRTDNRDLRSEPLLERLRDEVPVRREPFRERRGELDRLPCRAVRGAGASSRRGEVPDGEVVDRFVFCDGGRETQLLAMGWISRGIGVGALRKTPQACLFFLPARRPSRPRRPSPSPRPRSRRSMPS